MFHDDFQLWKLLYKWCQYSINKNLLTVKGVNMWICDFTMNLKKKSQITIAISRKCSKNPKKQITN